MEASTAFPPAPETERSSAPKKRVAAKKTAKAPAAKPKPEEVKIVSKAPKASVKASAELPFEKSEITVAKAASGTAKPTVKATKKTAKKALKKATKEVAKSAPEVVAATVDAPRAAVVEVPAPQAPPVVAAPVVHAPEPAVVIAPLLAAPPAPEPTPVAEAPQRVAPEPSPVAPASPVAEVTAPTPPPSEGGGQQQQHGQQREQRHGRHDRHRDRDRNRDRDRDRSERFEKPQREPQPERPLGPPEPTEGILELTPKGYGFLRQRSRQWAQLQDDPFVSPEWIRKVGLREGMFIKGVARMGHRGPQVTEILEVMGRDPETVRDLPLFEELKAINPNKRLQLETRQDRLTTRVMDLITPVGRGQRGLIVAPPRAGKTTLLQHIAEAVIQNHPQVHLMMLLVDERPEEVTEFRRALPTAEILASSNDSELKSHIRIATFAIERAKRLVECGQHVFILLDSITRMARSFNNAHKGGATASGGLGVGALESPRRLFAAARNTREAGSLTILATALIETNSRMDDAIFQEFKGTGNLELVLDRKIAEQYIYPAVNIFKSGTRREELLLPAFQMEKVHLLRRGLAGHKPIDAIQRVITLMERSPNNTQMLIDLPMKTSGG